MLMAIGCNNTILLVNLEGNREALVSTLAYMGYDYCDYTIVYLEAEIFE